MPRDQENLRQWRKQYDARNRERTNERNRLKYAAKAALSDNPQWKARLAAERKRYAESIEYRAKVAARCKRYRQNLKAEVMGYYSGGSAACACCDDKHLEFLTIDHIDGSGAKHRREQGSRTWGGGRILRWLRDAGYPSGYQVLCFNCNIATSFFGVCPHQRERNKS